MKEPEKLIRKFYAENNITHHATILFSYVRKSTTGGEDAKIEYYAARRGYVRGKRGKDIVTKLVMRFNPDTMSYSMSDSVVRYTSWSCLTTDHLIFDFHKELSGCYNYSRRCDDNVGGNRMRSLGKWKGEIMPTSEVPLNDFSGTKYEYCKYAFKRLSETAFTNVRSYSYWSRNPYGNLPDYLRKFNLNPRAMEMFASKGLTQLMKESFLIRLRDDKPFAKWYKRHALMTMNWSVYRIENWARREIGKTCFEIVRKADCRKELERKRRKLRREHLAEVRRKEEAERLAAQERAERAERILNLYNRIKSICLKYGAYEVAVPKSEAEMKREGEKMHNCVGHMFPMRQGVNAIVVFLRKHGKPCVDIEIDPKTFEVVQCRAVCNKNADDKAWNIARKVAEQLRPLLMAA